MEQKAYLRIVAHYESCLKKHGDTHLGVDWPKKNNVDIRYKVMLGVIRQNIYPHKINLLDFGCGASHLYEYIIRNDLEHIRYSGLDISEKFVQLSRKKFPANQYYCLDILDEGIDIPYFDYMILNGVFTEKRELPFDEMFRYLKRVLKTLFAKTRIGLAFNVMSKYVDWEREDLFHLPFDTLADFLSNELSRHFLFRNDYGLYEYTTYLYKKGI